MYPWQAGSARELTALLSPKNRWELVGQYPSFLILQKDVCPVWSIRLPSVDLAPLALVIVTCLTMLAALLRLFHLSTFLPILPGVNSMLNYLCSVTYFSICFWGNMNLGHWYEQGSQGTGHEARV